MENFRHKLGKKFCSFLLVESSLYDNQDLQSTDKKVDAKLITDYSQIGTYAIRSEPVL